MAKPSVKIIINIFKVVKIRCKQDMENRPSKSSKGETVDSNDVHGTIRGILGGMIQAVESRISCFCVTDNGGNGKVVALELDRTRKNLNRGT